MVALGASATIFDALADVDSKFAKVADKECDWVSGEVKKWFKKLAVRPSSTCATHISEIARRKRRRPTTSA